MIVGLIVLLALPTAGFATVALQTTDEEPRKLTAADAANVEAQFGTRTAATEGPAAAFDPFAAPGTTLSGGTNTQPSGPSKLLTYVLDEVSLPAGVPVPVLGGRTAEVSVLRLTVLGGPFVVRAMPPIIWIDDVPQRITAMSPDLSRISALVTDRSALRNGAVIAISYDEIPESRQRLTETLTLGTGAR